MYLCIWKTVFDHEKQNSSQIQLDFFLKEFLWPQNLGYLDVKSNEVATKNITQLCQWGSLIIVLWFFINPMTYINSSAKGNMKGILQNENKRFLKNVNFRSLAEIIFFLLRYLRKKFANIFLKKKRNETFSRILILYKVECPTRALKTWKLELELEISSSSQVRFNHYQFQVFKFKTWRTWKFQVKSSLKSYKLDLTWKLKVRELFQSQVNLRPNFAQNLMMIH